MMSTGTEASDFFFEMIFAKSPPKMSIFWKHVTQQKVYGKIRSSGVAENHTLCQSKLNEARVYLFMGCHRIKLQIV